MEIDNHILSLTMEFERFNIIINEHEMNKAKNTHDRSYTELRKKSLRKSASSKKPNGKPSETDPPDTESDKDEAYEGDKEESGFEDNGSATNEDEDEASMFTFLGLFGAKIHIDFSFQLKTKFPSLI